MTVVGDLAAVQRNRNARRITLTLGLLGFASIPPSIILHSSVNHIVFLSAVAELFAYAAARLNQTNLSIFMTLGITALEHVLVVVELKELGSIPYLAPLLVLVMAATLTARWLPVSLAISGATLAAEAYLSPWGKAEHSAIFVCSLITVVTFVVSLLHVQGTERALSFAETLLQERVEAMRQADAMREQLARGERMEALGRLAGGVAHDFNNLLTVITGSIEIAQSRSGDREATRDLDLALSATESASRLTHQLLTFSKREIVPGSYLEVGTTLQKKRSVYEELLGPRVELVFAFEPDLPPINIPESHVEQLAMNLAINARDAMSGAGRLVFGLKRRTLSPHEVSELSPGEYLEFSVADTGSGIDPAIRERLFDPFFTTKGHAGTGLGLATCYGITKRLSGAIVVESRLGSGTTFRVLLPVSGPSSSVPPRVTAAKGSETPFLSVRYVLVVDDEANILSVVQRQLERSGYSVIVASNLTEAQAFINDPDQPLDALLTDIMVGQERGTELIDLFQQRRPGKRIVVMSGYAPDPRAVETLRRVEAHFLPKPLTRDSLLRALEAVAAPVFQDSVSISKSVH
jgi:signal transduction histidine kinase/ActR/RegA family two-component response regulator